MRRVVTVLIFAAVLAVAFLFFIYLGFYNVSAALPRSGFGAWVFRTTVDNSVRRHAEGIRTLPLTESRAQKGAQLFDGYCTSCHGGPGIDRSAVGKGLNPSAPHLARVEGAWSDAELYWITKNGIRMSGMPAFGQTLKEDEIWSLVAFLRQLPAMTPERFREITGKSEAKPQN